MIKANIYLFCKVTIIILVTILTYTPSVVFAATGDLQVTCEPGVRIFIDDDFKGKTNDFDNGLFIEGLTPGRHNLKAVKTDFQPITKEISIIENKAIEVKIRFDKLKEEVKELKPQVEESVAKVGDLELRSVPLGAIVFVDGQKKGIADLEIKNVGVGKHVIIFQKDNQKLSGFFQLDEGEILKLKAHFKNNIIINITKNEKLEAEKIKEEAKIREAEERKKLIYPLEDYLDNTLKDASNGLLWTAGVAVTTTYEEALSYCVNLNKAGIRGWELPNESDFMKAVVRVPERNEYRLNPGFYQNRVCWIKENRVIPAYPGSRDFSSGELPKGWVNKGGFGVICCCRLKN